MMSKRKSILLLLYIIIGYNLYSQTTIYPQNSVLNSGVWYSVSITEDGVYKLTYNDFVKLGVDPSEINFDNLSIYGNGGKAIEEEKALYTFSDLKENAIYVDKKENCVLFYAKATTQIIYNASAGEFSFSLHPYATSTKYFITFDPNIGQKKRITNLTDIPTEISTQTNTAKTYTFHKRELNNLNESGRYWLGEKFLPVSTDLQIPMNLTNIVSTDDVSIKIRLLTNSTQKSSYDINLNNNEVGTLTLSTSDGGSIHQGIFSKQMKITNASNTFNLHFNTSSSTAVGYLDYILINYNQKLSLNNNYLHFYSIGQDKTKSIKYSVDNVRTNNVMIWDVTESNDVKMVEYTALNDNTLEFLLPSDTIRDIAVLANYSFPSPTLEDTVENQNLHGIDSSEFIIITHPKFISQAERLAEIHRKYDNIKVSVVQLQEVFNEFSSGTKDFLAIREFIAMVYNKTNGQYPKNVLLFGDGTYDNKNILGYDNNYIPTYQSVGNSVTSDNNFTSDDVLAAFGESSTNNTLDTLFVGIGRIPVQDTNQANIVVDKCERYITKSDILAGEFGDWRNAVLLTSDDMDELYEKYFRDNAEHIFYQIEESNPGLNVQKVYEDAYKEYNSSSGSTYPDASKAVNERMNKGCLLMNYLGHGSPDHLSSERLIQITDITSWQNYNKLCLMITSTCEFNRFDLADQQSAGEYVLLSENGAGIGLIAAARKISSNDPINRALFRFALEKQSNGKNYTFGQIMQQAKNLVNTGYYGSRLTTAERSITLIGDPALRLSLPEYDVNTLGIEVTNPNITNTKNNNDTIRALSTVTVTGEIVDNKKQRVETFNGTVQVSLYDKKSVYYMLNNSSLSISKDDLAFEQQNNVLHKGTAKVENGYFTHTFIVPKDIAYNYGNGKLSYYAQSDSTDAAGYYKDFILGGIDTNNVDTTVARPQLRLYLNDTNFVSGGISDENPKLYAIVFDSLPINTVGSGLGHNIVARLDNAANTFILNEYYVSSEEDKNIGYITYPFEDLTEGEHTLTLKVWNIYNLSAEKTIKFTVKNSDEKDYQTIAYPNPFRDAVDIELRYNQPQTISSAHIKIFNSQGAIVSEFDVSDKIGSYTVGPIHWNATTQGGTKVKKGIYFYSIILDTKDGEKIVRGDKMICLD